MAIQTHSDTQMPLRIAHVHDAADGIRSFELVQPDGTELPPFTPGSHVRVQAPNGSMRKYSLCNDPGERHRYVITVHALDVAPSGLNEHTAPGSLEAKLSRHTLGRGTLTGIFERH